MSPGGGAWREPVPTSAVEGSGSHRGNRPPGTSLVDLREIEAHIEDYRSADLAITRGDTDHKQHVLRNLALEWLLEVHIPQLIEEVKTLRAERERRGS